MKKITIVGNIGKDAECREGAGGHKFVTFSVAHGERETDARGADGTPVKKALWSECEMYVKPETSAEGLLKVLTKGRHIFVEAYEKGDEPDAWIDKEGKPRARIVYRVLTFEV